MSIVQDPSASQVLSAADLSSEFNASKFARVDLYALQPGRIRKARSPEKSSF